MVAMFGIELGGLLVLRDRFLDLAVVVELRRVAGNHARLERVAAHAACRRPRRSRAPTHFRENFRIGRMRTVANGPLVVKWGSCTFTRVKYLCTLGFLTLCGVRAHGQEPGHAATSAPREAELRGRVFERGTLTPLNGARIVTQWRRDRDRMTMVASRLRCRSRRDPGRDDRIEGYEPLEVTENLAAGRRRSRSSTACCRCRPIKKRYVSTVRGEARHEGERFPLRDEELHRLAGHARRSLSRHRPAPRRRPRR